VALLVFGEGWHNNHHAFPRSARHGLGRLQLDLSWWTIRCLEKLRLARSVRVPTAAQLARTPRASAVSASAG
jgi:stearoyl-CoA desaturase (delta-9 desaturase)